MLCFVGISGHVLEFLVPGFRRPVLLCRGRMPRARGMVAYVRDGYRAFRQLYSLSVVVCEMLFLRVCVAKQNLSVFTLYRNLDLYDRIIGC